MNGNRANHHLPGGLFRRIAPLVLYLCPLLILIFSDYHQAQAQILIPDRFNSLLIFDQRTDAGTRSSGMGRANTAAVNDLTAIVSNPAALSRVGEINFYVSFSYDNRELVPDSYAGDQYLNWQITPQTNFKLNYFSAVFRWLDVHLGFAVGKHSLFPESVNHRISLGNDQSYQWQVAYDSGVKTSLSGAVSVDITRSFYIGAAFHFWSTGQELVRVQRSASFDRLPPGTSEQARQMSDYATINFGFLYTGFTGINLGLNLHLPHTIEIRPSYIDSDEELAAVGYVYLKNIKVKYPLALTAGFSWQIFSDIQVAADYRYDPWSLIKLENPINEKTPSFDMNAIHFGIEYDWHPGTWHLPLRAGFYLQPVQVRTGDGGQLNLPVFTLGNSVYIGKFRLDLGLEWMPVDYSLNEFDFDAYYSLNQVSIKGNYFRFSFDFMFSSDYQNAGKK